MLNRFSTMIPHLYFAQFTRLSLLLFSLLFTTLGTAADNEYRLDESFSFDLLDWEMDPMVKSVVLDDGRILLSGGFDQVNGVKRANLILLDAQGNLDTNFNPSSEFFYHLLNARNMANGNIFLELRYSRSRGDKNPTAHAIFQMTPNGQILENKKYHIQSSQLADQKHVALLSDGSFLLSYKNDNASLAGDPKYFVQRYKFSSSGTAEPVPEFERLGINGTVYSLFAGDDEHMFVHGYFTRINDKEVHRLVQINSKGEFVSDDKDTNPWSVHSGYFMTRLGNGELFFYGDTSESRGFFRLDENGKIDPSFQLPSDFPTSTEFQLYSLPSGKYYIFDPGYSYTRGTYLYRLNNDGSLDESFSKDDFMPNDDFWMCVGTLLDGSLMTVGRNEHYPLQSMEKLSTAGVVDNNYSFTLNPVSNTTTLEWTPGGELFFHTSKIIKSELEQPQQDFHFNSGKLNSNGSVRTFISDDLTIRMEPWNFHQTDGTMISQLTMTSNPPPFNFTLFRVNRENTIDPGFHAFDPYMEILVETADNKFLVYTQELGDFSPTIARIHADGSLDTSFHNIRYNISYTHYLRSSLTLANDGSLYMMEYGKDYIYYIHHWHANGKKDTTFISPEIEISGVYHFAIRDEFIYIMAESLKINGVSKNFGAKLTLAGQPVTSYTPELTLKLIVGSSETAHPSSLYQTDGSLFIFARFMYATELNPSVGLPLVKINPDGMVIKISEDEGWLNPHVTVNDIGDALVMGDFVNQTETIPTPRIVLYTKQQIRHSTPFTRLLSYSTIPVSLELHTNPDLNVNYQWYKDTTLIEGAISNTLTFTTLDASHAGDYYAMMTSGILEQQSRTITLTQPQALQFTKQSEDKTFWVGSKINVSIELSGNPQPVVTWTKDGQPIEGAQGQTLRIKDLTEDDVGVYVAIATSPTGTIVSAPIILGLSFFETPGFPTLGAPLKVSKTEDGLLFKWPTDEKYSYFLNSSSDLIDWKWIQGTEESNDHETTLFLSNAEIADKVFFRVEAIYRE